MHACVSSGHQHALGTGAVHVSYSDYCNSGSGTACSPRYLFSGRHGVMPFLSPSPLAVRTVRVLEALDCSTRLD